MKIGLVTAGVLIFISTSIGQIGISQRYIHVQLIVHAEPEIEYDIKSNLTRELINLFDVDLVDENPHFIISVNALQIHQPDRIAGHVIAFDILKPYENKILAKALEYVNSDSVDDDIKQCLIKETEHLYHYPTTILYVGAVTDIRYNCEEFIRHFNAQFLDSFRRTIKSKLTQPKDSTEAASQKRR